MTTSEKIRNGKVVNINVPKGWEIMELGKTCLKFLNGGTPSTQNSAFWQGKIPRISGADFSNQKISEIRRFINAKAIKNSSTNLIPKGWLLLVTRTGAGKMTIAPFDVAISQDITGVQVNEKIISTEFLFRFLEFNSKGISSLNQGTSINGITRDVLLQIKINIPPLVEQHKIASILSTWDKAIEIAEQLITEKQKRALMQQLLTGKRRFKEFKKEKWNRFKINELGKVVSGGTPDTTKPEYWDGNLSWCTPTDITALDGKNI